MITYIKPKHFFTCTSFWFLNKLLPYLASDQRIVLSVSNNECFSLLLQHLNRRPVLHSWFLYSSLFKSCLYSLFPVYGRGINRTCQVLFLTELCISSQQPKEICAMVGLCLSLKSLPLQTLVPAKMIHEAKMETLEVRWSDFISLALFIRAASDLHYHHGTGWGSKALQLMQASKLPLWVHRIMQILSCWTLLFYRVRLWSWRLLSSSCPFPFTVHAHKAARYRLNLQV